jgi:iron complex outermembrane receptor protein
VGDAKVKGFELESELHPLANAIIDLSAAYVDFKYTRLDPATGISLDDTPPLVPAFKAAIGAQYRIDLGDRIGSITPRLDFNYIARQQERAINIPQSWNPGYGLLNARITWSNAAGDTSVALEGSNLLDKYYAIVSSYNYPPSSSSLYSAMNPGPPRMVAVNIRRSF